MTGVKTQTYRSNCGQFLAKSGRWLPGWTIKTTFLKAVSKPWSQFPVRRSDDICHHGGAECLREVFISQVLTPCGLDVNMATVDLSLMGLDHLFSRSDGLI